MDLKKDFTHSEIRALLNIYKFHSLNKTTWGNLCQKINVLESNPLYRKVYNYLKEINAITVVEIIGPTKFIKIDHKIITDLIDEQIIINDIVANYLEKEHFFKW